MQHYVNGREIRIIGMSRSGNHAVINWLLAQLRGRYCFLNCTEPGLNPFVSARPLEDGQLAIANYPLDLPAEQKGMFAPKDDLVYSHEDVFLGPVGRRHSDHDAWTGGSAARLDVLILRDPFNLFASRIKSGFDWYMSHRHAMRVWKQHAREALKPRHLSPERVVIRYNDWVYDRHYRARIGERLGLSLGDRWVNRVARCNGGSSFDGLDYDGRPDGMRILERWRHYRGDAHYRGLFDRQVAGLAQAVFGAIPGTEALHDLAA